MPRLARSHPGTRDRTRWFSQAPALALMGAEQRALIPSITGVFGQAGLYIRPSSSAPPDLSGNMVLSVLRLHGDGAALEGDLRCDGRSLPVTDESMSLVYVLHAFDTCPDPGQMAGEIARVLAPEGIAVVVGLNPFSPWLLRWAGRGPLPRPAGPVSAQLGAHGLHVFRRSGVGPVWSAAAAARTSREHGGYDWLAPVRAGYALQARKRREGWTGLLPAASRPALALKPFAHSGCMQRRS